ncbi:MAG: ACP S-malonyltransferase [Proteobacteria bacterium]|nr:ACP S-malonyltransferase [Pseudomonadota bacterium]
MIAFVFPGQGAQQVGMGRALAERYPEAREIFERADEALGFSISRLCFEGPDDQLKLTANGQPAILTVSMAVHAVVRRELGVRPQIVAGHSLGEYSALVAAGALTLEDAVRLVHQRGRFMQDAVPAGQGGMAAVMGLEEAAVAELCAEAAGDEILAPANFNGGKQIVIAGHLGAVARGMALAKARGARAVPLKVSAPFHCPLMQPAADRLREALAAVAIHPLRVPLVTNVEAEVNQDHGRVAELLATQVTAPVRWEQSVQRLSALGVGWILELGPGKVLSGLIRRVCPEVAVDAVESPEQIEALREQRAAGLGVVAISGHADCWAAEASPS